MFALTDASDTTPPAIIIACNPTSPSGGTGWDVVPVGITVTAEDDPTGSGVAEIRCEVNPPLYPTIFDELPDAPCAYLDGATISSNGEYWVYAASIDANGNRSAVTELSVRIDNEPREPTVTLDPPTPGGPDGVYTVPVSARLWSGGSSGSGHPETRCVLDPPVPPASSRTCQLPFAAMIS